MDGEERYAELLARQEHSPTLRKLYSIAFGADYPAEADPWGFVTCSDLSRIARLLDIAAGDLFADFGCGRGGPGLWLAKVTGASLIGLDILAIAIEQAERRKKDFVPSHRAAFRVASFQASGLADESLDAAVSIDVLWMVADKPGALAEAARVLKPGRRLVLTTWEAPPLDYADLLAAVGLQVLVREETPSWLSRQLTFYEGVLASASLLRAELGAAASSVLVEEARRTRRLLPATPRLLMVARK
jgi:ubiquinone/menaquinone biosynthesis C-methylase UbiE